MGTALRVGVAVVVLVVVVVALAWVFQRRMVYLPFGGPDGPAGAYLDGGRDVVLQTEDGLDLAAWWAPATGPARDRTVLVAPGNGGSRVLRVPLAQALAAEGFDVLLVEYRGYGGNPGSPTEEGLAADVGAAYRYLVEEHGVAPDRLVLFGESLGGAPLTRLATERPVGALVLRSPFTSLADVGVRAYPFLPVRALLRDRFPLLEYVRSVRVPVAVVAGAADEIVPVEQSRAVAEAAGAAYVEVPDARHNDPELNDGPAVVHAVVQVVGR
ncbi:alpha/beta hydrolase [Pseudonocardia sp. DSM 110487]|uniref:alpha/beta hydrolase n=1 Tax=Pseudonocardia sp. DSM 110487 TaxID=2865833 RepID=UPI001C6A07E5|nr:alpha/beta fold hydrolase [Pseudonocardia sp. DSM 110487]QYN32431.1 alpha/beta hydrolase [Pseudonocardia sp. DSM 110487]